VSDGFGVVGSVRSQQANERLPVSVPGFHPVVIQFACTGAGLWIAPLSALPNTPGLKGVAGGMSAEASVPSAGAGEPAA
jgi:hypothetical protein